MALDLDKVAEKAPQLLDLVKDVGMTLEKYDLDPSKFPAAVLGFTDHSGSTKDRRLYSDGDRRRGVPSTMQRVSNVAFAAGLQFDDDGTVPWWLFDTEVHKFGDITLDNCRDFMDRHDRFGYGGTSYLRPLRAIVREAGFSGVDLQSAAADETARKGLFRGRWGSQDTSSRPTLRVRGTAPYPTYAIIITDGDPQADRPEDIEEYMTLISQLPIFVQFVGVGDGPFNFLEKLDGMEGRFVDNANFFDSRDAVEFGGRKGSTTELMLKEFAGEYYPAARKLGLLRAA